MTQALYAHMNNKRKKEKKKKELELFSPSCSGGQPVIAGKVLILF
jgi:hypothetical protein